MSLIQKVTLLIIIYLLITPKLCFADPLSFSLSPVIKEITVKPGEEKTFNIMALNPLKKELETNISVYPFAPSDMEGNVEIRTQDETSKKWIFFEDENLPQDTMLEASKISNFPFKVAVPKNAKEGDYYLAILFSAKDSNNSNNSKLIIRQKAQISSLILLKVETNPEPQKIQISKFSTSVFFTKGPVNFNIQVVNNGRTLVKTKGTIEIKNIFNQNVATIIIPSHTILASSERSLKNYTQTLSWNPNKPFGLYTAYLNLMDDKSEKPLLASKTVFFSIPIEAVYFLIVFIILILLTKIRKLIF